MPDILLMPWRQSHSCDGSGQSHSLVVRSVTAWDALPGQPAPCARQGRGGAPRTCLLMSLCRLMPPWCRLESLTLEMVEALGALAALWW